jgi:hypothetical protein
MLGTDSRRDRPRARIDFIPRAGSYAEDRLRTGDKPCAGDSFRAKGNPTMLSVVHL